MRQIIHLEKTSNPPPSTRNKYKLSYFAHGSLGVVIIMSITIRIITNNVLMDANVWSARKSNPFIGK
jgi:hypothetical protein